MSLVTLTDAIFENEVLKSDVPVLVDFWAPWCGPCRVVNPIVEKLAEEFEGKPVKIAKLNVDENPQFASNYGIMSIPTLLIFKNGQVIEHIGGVLQEDILREKLTSAIE